MPFHTSGDLRYYSLDLFDQAGIVHGFFTRHGGVSPAPWASLNHGGTTGDARVNVIENRRRMFDVFGLRVETIFDAWQVHGREVLCADRPRPLDAPHQKADGILTSDSQITLVMRFADCVPVLLYDPVKGVTGVVHAGWQGTVQKAVEAAITRMKSAYGCRPENVLAGIGPSICADHYQVGSEVVEAVRHSFGEDANAILRPINGTSHLDLRKANEIILERCGVRKVEVAGICTACKVEDWYSHRAEHGKTGRYGVLLSGQTLR